MTLTPTKKISLQDNYYGEEIKRDERAERDARLKKLADEAERITSRQQKQQISPIVEEETILMDSPHGLNEEQLYEI